MWLLPAAVTHIHRSTQQFHRNSGHRPLITDSPPVQYTSTKPFLSKHCSTFPTTQCKQDMKCPCENWIFNAVLSLSIFNVHIFHSQYFRYFSTSVNDWCHGSGSKSHVIHHSTTPFNSLHVWWKQNVQWQTAVYQILSMLHREQFYQITQDEVSLITTQSWLVLLAWEDHLLIAS